MRSASQSPTSRIAVSLLLLSALAILTVNSQKCVAQTPDGECVACDDNSMLINSNCVLVTSSTSSTNGFIFVSNPRDSPEIQRLHTFLVQRQCTVLQNAQPVLFSYFLADGIYFRAKYRTQWGFFDSLTFLDLASSNFTLLYGVQNNYGNWTVPNFSTAPVRNFTKVINYINDAIFNKLDAWLRAQNSQLAGARISMVYVLLNSNSRYYRVTYQLTDASTAQYFVFYVPSLTSQPFRIFTINLTEAPLQPVKPPVINPNPPINQAYLENITFIYLRDYQTNQKFLAADQYVRSVLANITSGSTIIGVYYFNPRAAVDLYKIAYRMDIFYYEVFVVFYVDINRYEVILFKQYDSRSVADSNDQHCVSANLYGCRQCDKGFHIFENKCFYDIGGCVEYIKGMICLKCKDGFLLINNFCTSDCGVLCNTINTPGTNTKDSTTLPNCNKATPEGLCVECQPRYWPKNGVCTKVSESCYDYNQTSGRCTSCQKNFRLSSGGSCTSEIPQCSSYNNDGSCKSCTSGYILTNNGTCAVNTVTVTVPFCQIYLNGKCAKCVNGYKLNGDVCTLLDQGCNQWSVDGKCLQCVKGYNLEQGVCKIIVGNCQIPGLNGKCLSCYYTFRLTPDGMCVADPIKYANPLCKTWNQAVCVECAFRAYFDNDYICQAVSDQCNMFDPKTGVCLSCYKGYTLMGQGECVQGDKSYCTSFDSNGWCIGCRQGYFVNRGLCAQANPLCVTYNPTNGNCLSCFQGYVLSGALCKLAPVS